MKVTNTGNTKKVMAFPRNRPQADNISNIPRYMGFRVTR